jgi:hypothetical protein
MTNFHLRWVLHESILDLHFRRLEICGRQLPVLETRELDSYWILVTGDRTWFVLEHQNSIKLGVARHEVLIKMSQTIITTKVIF